MRPLPFTSLLLALALAGCGGSHADRPLIPDLRSPVADVPVPAGFTLAGDSQSKVDDITRSRWVDHRYKGGDDVLPVANFYRDELPKHDWKLLDQSQPNGKEVALHFQKNKEDLTVTVTKHSFNTQIHIHLEAGKSS